MPRPLLAVVAATALTVLAALLIAGVGPWAGPRLVGVTETHGVHAGDLLVAVAWLAGISATLVLALRRD